MYLTIPEKQCLEDYELNKFVDVRGNHYVGKAIQIFEICEIDERMNNVIDLVSKIIETLLMNDNELKEHLENTEKEFPIRDDEKYQKKATQTSKLIIIKSFGQDGGNSAAI